MTDFSVGDVVRLKGHAQRMTVLRVHGTDEKAEVAWFVGATAHRDMLPLAALAQADSHQGSPSGAFFTCPQCGNWGLFSALPGTTDVCTDCANDDRGLGRICPPKHGFPRAAKTSS